jgi:hypothetical protein
MATKKAAAKKKAAKKKSALTPAVFPKAVTAPEKHPFLAWRKSMIMHYRSLERQPMSTNTVEVAWYLVALGRIDEARELCEWIAKNISYKEKDYRWERVVDALILLARLARLRNDQATRKKAIKRVLEHPLIWEMEWPYWLDQVERGDKRRQQAEQEKEYVWACQLFTAALQEASYFRETAGMGTYYDDWVELDLLDKTIDRSLKKLRALLNKTKR